MAKLTGKKIAILATDGFEYSELKEPLKALQHEGAEVEIISLHEGEIRSWKKNNWGESQKVDHTVKNAAALKYDALVLPGGVLNADSLRNDKDAVNFVQEFVTMGKPIAAICHAAWTLIETRATNGRTMTSWSSLKTDLENAGVRWIDEEVVIDQRWITSRKPDDLPAFNKKMIEEFQQSDYEARVRFADHERDV